MGVGDQMNEAPNHEPDEDRGDIIEPPPWVEVVTVSIVQDAIAAAWDVPSWWKL